MVKMYPSNSVKSVIIFFLIQFTVCHSRDVTNGMSKLSKSRYDDCVSGDFPTTGIPIQVTDQEFTEFFGMANFGTPTSSECGAGQWVEGINYIKITPSDNSIKLEPKNMPELEELTEYTNEALPICIQIQLAACNINQSVILLVHDTNNHDPQLVVYDNSKFIPKQDFEYKVPMPLPANINIFDFGDTIFAKDIDFSNENVTFSITGDDLKFVPLGYHPGTNTKVHATKLVVSKSLSFPNKEYTIFIQDTGDPRRSAQGTVKVIRDEEASVTNPQFEKAFYSAVYDGETFVVNEDIILTDGKNANVEVFDEGYIDHFKQISNSNPDGKIILEIIKEKFDTIKKQTLTITLTANVANQVQPAKTTIYINMQNNHPEFTKPYYEGSYNGDKLEMEDVTWKNWKNADIKILPEECAQFIKATKNNEVINVSLEDLQDFKGPSITITLGAFVEDGVITANTVIKIKLENKELQFKNIIYEGTYDGDTLEMSQIQLSNGKNAIVDILETGYKNFFKPISNDDGKINLEINKDAFDTIKKQSLTITLTATLDDQLAKTTIYIKMLNNQPKFDKPYYEGSYDGQNLHLDTITWQNWKNADVKVFPEDSQQFFHAEKNNNVIDVKLNDLDNFEGSFIKITLGAYVENEDVIIAETDIKINLENKKIKFKENYYEGNFDGTNLNYDKIELENGDSATLYIIEEEYYKYFDKSISNGMVLLTSKGLENFNENSIRITLLAYLESKDNAAKTVIKIKLEQKQVHFEKNYYEGTYNQTLTMEPIKLLNGNKAIIDIVEEGSDNFVDVQNNEGVIKIDLKNLEGFPKSSIQITLRARIGSDDAKTAIKIILENKQLIFKQNYYEGSFDGTLDIAEIRLENGNTAKLEILEEDYKKYFDPKNNNGLVDLSLKDLQDFNGPSITINLVAYIETEATSAQTVIKIILEAKKLYFENNYYEGIYDGKNLNIAAIKLINGEVATLDILEDELEEYFNKNNNKGTIEISLKGIEDFKEISIKITLLAKVGAIVAQTTVNIMLENNFIRFEKVLYEAHYKDSELTAPTMTLFNADNTDFKILETNYEKYFLISNTKSNVNIALDTSESLSEVDKSHILITLYANQKNDPKNNARTTINIYLDDKVINAYFDKSLYLGSSDGQSLSIKNIKLLNGNIATCTIIDTDYVKYFEVTVTNDILVEVTLKDGETLSEREESTIILTLEANVENQSKPARTAIQIDLIKNKLQFENSLYGGYYIGKTLQIDSINLQNGKSADVDIVDSDYKQYFKVRNTNGVVEVYLNLNESLSSEKVSSILITLTARDGTNFAQTAVEIELKDNEIPEPEIEEPYYEASFDGEVLKIGPITLPSGGRVAILEDEYKDYFGIDYKDNKAIITLNGTKDLNDREEPSIIVTLVASWNRKLVTSKCIIHIKLEKNNKGPQFKELQYIGNFDGEELTIDGPIEIVGGNVDDAKISEEEYASFFRVEWRNNLITVALIKAPELSLINKELIILTLEAIVQAAPVKAIIRINLNNNLKLPRFENNLYKGSFDGDNLKIVDTIKFVGGTIDNLEILEPEYQFFNTVKDVNGKIEITVKEDEKENLSSIDQPYIVITLVATIQNQLVKTAVLIELTKTTGTTTSSSIISTTGGTSAGSDETSEPIGYIAAIAVLSALLVLFICGAGGFWYFKLRNKSTFKKFDNDSEDGVATTENKSVNFSAIEEPEFDTNVSQRRPTGFVFHPPPPEDDTEDEDDDSSSSDDSKSSSSISQSKRDESDDDSTDGDQPDTPRSLDRRKSVTFIENIDKIEIERSHDNYEDDDDKDDEKK